MSNDDERDYDEEQYNAGLLHNDETFDERDEWIGPDGIDALRAVAVAKDELIAELTRHADEMRAMLQRISTGVQSVADLVAIRKVTDAYDNFIKEA